jgi:peptidyl-dipeptidase A
MKKYVIIALTVLTLSSCSQKEGRSLSYDYMKDSVNIFLNEYTKQYQMYLLAANEAEWKLNIYIKDGDTISSKNADDAKKSFAKFTGSKFNYETAKRYLVCKSSLNNLQIRQFETIIFAAGGNPEIAESIVKQKIEAETKQTKNLYGYSFKIDGKEVTTNKIDEILIKSENLSERQKAWEVSKEVGIVLKDGLVNLQNLRNKSVQALGYKDFFAYQSSEYNMSSSEMRTLCHSMIKDLWPLYRELHTWARYTLAEKYRQEVPEFLPAHWLPNRWGQDWSSLVNLKGINLDDTLKIKGPEWIVKTGENFYMSLGFDALPQTFWQKSNLYPVPKGSDYKKNNHASAWHFDNDKDVRSLMSIEPNTEWWETSLHELGHIYYYMTYSNSNVPLILRGGANRGYHEAMGTMIGLASMQLPFLKNLKLVPEEVKADEIQSLMKEALSYVTIIPWGAGVMTDFEWELYSNNLPKNQYNAKWWELVKKYQGIVPPTIRGEEYCDAATKTHINDDAAQYYDYSISTVLLFQFHDFIAKNILKQEVHNTNYFGSKETGDFIRKIMYPGASVDWREHLKNSIGTDMSAKPMLDYFAPLMTYLKSQNKGRKYSLKENF